MQTGLRPFRRPFQSRSPAAADAQPARRPRYYLILALSSLLLALLIFIGEALLLHMQPALSLPVDAPAANLLLQGVHEAEADRRGMFRWTSGNMHARFYGVRAGRKTILDLKLSPSPAQKTPAVELVFRGGQEVPLLVSGSPRNYQVLLPPQAVQFDNLDLTISSPISYVEGDPRPLGVRLEGLTLHREVESWLEIPSQRRVAAHWLLLAGVPIIIATLGLPLGPAIGGLFLLALLSGLVNRNFPLIAGIYFERLAVPLLLLAAITIWLLPPAERRLQAIAPPGMVRSLWGAALLACAIRLSGALFPLFNAFDLPLNLNRFLAAAAGTMVMTNESFEFGGGITVYPPGPYLLLLPAMLAGLAPGLIIQAGIGLIDGLSSLAIGALTYGLGAGHRAAIAATLLYAALPIAMTSLYYGHTAQIFGQALMAPLALALLTAVRRARPQVWLAIGTLLSMALLSHIGVTILAVAWVGLLWTALGLRRTMPPAAWRHLGLALFIAGVIGFIFAYAPVVLLHLEELTGVGRRVAGNIIQPSYNLIAKAWWIAFAPLGLALFALGLRQLPAMHLPAGGIELIAAWLAAVAIFWAVEMATGLQVRYLIFLSPLVCLFGGLLLARLAQRGAAGRLVMVFALSMLIAQGALLWYQGVFAGIAPSMVPLLR